MKRTGILLLAVVFLSSIPVSPARHRASMSGDGLAAQSLRLGNTGAPGDARMPEAKVTMLFGNLPLYFVENKGQVNGQVKYYAKLPSGSVYFTGGEIVYQFLLRDEKKAKPGERVFPPDIKGSGGEPPAGISSAMREAAIRITFVGANKKSRPEAQGEQEALFSYFEGNDPQKWVSGARSYRKVAYRELYPGIDLVVSGTQGRLKNEYVVKPGSDPAAIRLHYGGAGSLRVNQKGQLEIQTSAGMLVEDVPLSYQVLDGERTEVRTRYQIAADQAVRFEVGEYKKDTELVIDPLTYATFLGGTQDDNGRKIAVDGSGNVYVTGQTLSTNFPTTPGAYDTGHNLNWDVFVAKLNSSGSSLLYSTFIGGSGTEYPRGLALDGTGNVFVAGSTNSASYPTTAGAYDTSHNGSNDAFVTKLNSSGSTLLYSTFLGASANDYCHSIAIDGSGNAYISGDTTSNAFPTTAGAFDTTWNAGTNDSYVAKLNSSGTELSYSTYLGGSGNEYAYGIAVDGTGNAYITGITTSTDFPTTIGAYDTTHNGGSQDAFIAKLNSAGSALTYSTYVGGPQSDNAYGIIVDGSGNACIAGHTLSPAYPTTTGAYDTSHNGSNDIFVTRIDSTATSLLYSTFVGGTYADYAYHLAADGSGNLYIAGYTISDDFPTTAGAHDASYNLLKDALLVKLNSIATVLLYSTYLGGAADDDGYGLAVGGIGNAYVIGTTNSANFPVTSGSYDTGYNSLTDAFVAKFATGGTPDIRQPISAISFGDVGVGSASDQMTTIYNDGTDSLTVNSITRTSGSTDFTYQSPSVPFSISAGGSQSVTVRFAPTSLGARSAVFNVNSNDPDESDVTFDVSGTGVAEIESLSTPAVPTGPDTGFTDTVYTFTAGGSSSNLGHDVQYLIDWGDGTDTGWLAVGTTSAQKSWSSAGTSSVKAKARCATHTAVESSWSSSLSVSIAVLVHDNSPSNYQVIPECIWAVATGGGTWVSEVQITDITGGSVVSVYFDYGAGNRRGPFTLWTSPGADRNVKFANILSSMDALDSEAFTYYGRVGAVEFLTQDVSHKIHVVARTLNGNYSKTFPGLNLTDSSTANTSRRMILQNFVNNATYRSTCGFFNPTPDSVTLELKLIDANGSQIGSGITRTLVGHDFQSFSPFNQAGVPYPANSYDNVVLWITPTSGLGKVMVFGASANNTSNDPAAHIGVQYQ